MKHLRHIDLCKNDFTTRDSESKKDFITLKQLAYVLHQDIEILLLSNGEENEAPEIKRLQLRSNI